MGKICACGLRRPRRRAGTRAAQPQVGVAKVYRQSAPPEYFQSHNSINVNANRLAELVQVNFHSGNRSERCWPKLQIRNADCVPLRHVGRVRDRHSPVAMQAQPLPNVAVNGGEVGAGVDQDGLIVQVSNASLHDNHVGFCEVERDLAHGLLGDAGGRQQNQAEEKAGKGKRMSDRGEVADSEMCCASCTGAPTGNGNGNAEQQCHPTPTNLLLEERGEYALSSEIEQGYFGCLRLTRKLLIAGWLHSLCHEGHR